jgi:hypothetical protein
VLPHGPIKRLVETGTVEVWTPQGTAQVCGRCGARMTKDPRCPRCHLLTAGESVIVEPDLNAYQVVRRRYHSEAITRAKGREVRPSLLQDLTYPEALAAGFKTRDDFYSWWRLRYATGPLMAPIDCFVVTYDHVAEDEAYFLSNPIPGKQGDFTKNRHHASDDLETVDAEEWARKAEKDRELHAAQQRAIWRARRRGRAA